MSPTVWYFPASPGASDGRNQGLTTNLAAILQAEGPIEQLWLLGQGPSPRWGRALRCSSERDTGARVIGTVSPRAHPESVLGLAAFEDRPSWAWPRIAQAMRERCPTCTPALAARTRDRSIQASSVRIPTQSLAPDGLSLPKAWGVYELARAREDWTTVLHIKADDLWLAPGLVWGAGITPDLREANLQHLMKSLQWLQSQKPLRVLPEQGPVGDTQLVAQNLAYWRSLHELLESAVRAGGSLNDALIAQTFSHPTWASYARANTVQQRVNRERHLINLQRAWREIEDAYFESLKPRQP